MQILYFAWVRERIGAGAEELEPPEAVRTVADLADWLRNRSQGHAEALADLTKLRAAVDQRFVSLDTPFGSAKEVAFFPPVTGG
jgi:molybdopterin synthase sulfur carrier subunit